VNEVPGLQAAFLTLDHEHALAGDDEEVLLAALAVVHAPLTRGYDLDAEAELRPLLPTFEVGVLPALLAPDPRCVACVEHEPALALGNEPGVRPLQLSLRDADPPFDHVSLSFRFVDVTLTTPQQVPSSLRPWRASSCWR
jgi:hypothetical protein